MPEAARSVSIAEVSSLRIQERFVSIQGEGSLVGVPSSFVRVAGCNLRCAWCDSPKTSWAPEGEPTDVDALVRWCSSGPRHVVLTGGEPLLFGPAAELSLALRAAGHHLTIETAGSVRREGFEADLMSISPKLSHSTPWDRAAAIGKPSLAQAHERARIDLEVLRGLVRDYDWQLKFVVRTEPAALEADLAEIDTLVEQLGVGDDDRHRVLLMPEGTEGSALIAGYQTIDASARARGFRLGYVFTYIYTDTRPGPELSPGVGPGVVRRELR